MPLIIVGDHFLGSPVSFLFRVHFDFCLHINFSHMCANESCYLLAIQSQTMKLELPLTYEI